MQTKNPSFLTLSLGQDVKQQMASCQLLKDTLVQCMILLFEAGAADQGNQYFTQVCTLYQETHLHTFYLQDQN